MTESQKQQLYAELGLRIRDAREKAGLTQVALAELLDFSRVSMVNIEKGKQRPPLDVLYRIALATNANLIDLLPITSITLRGQYQYNCYSNLKFEEQLSNYDSTIKDNIKQFILDTRNSTTSNVFSFNRVKGGKNT